MSLSPITFLTKVNKKIKNAFIEHINFDNYSTNLRHNILSVNGLFSPKIFSCLLYEAILPDYEHVVFCKYFRCASLQ